MAKCIHLPSRFLPLVVTAVLGFTSISVAHAQKALRADAPHEINLPAGTLSKALDKLVDQSGVQIVYETSLADGIKVTALSGTLSVRQALAQLLNNTGLRADTPDDRVVVLKRVNSTTSNTDAQEQMRLAAVQNESNAAPHVANEEDVDLKGIPELLVRGSRGGSTDIRRSNDDVQPYVVFDTEEIELSMASSLDDFLRSRLPMNQSRSRQDQATTMNAMGNMSEINLRGLGVEETLVLVNGRRMPGVAQQGAGTGQADINGIPLSAIERIEILPSTAGGIYGGGATGGVVNVVLKRDYNNVEVTARYDGTFRGGGAERRLDATAGFMIGRTEIMLIASHRNGSPLYIGDRDFAARSRALQFQNNPGVFLTGTNPVYGYTTNIRSVVINPTTGAVSAGTAPLVLRNGTALNSITAQVAEGSAGYATDGAFAFRPGYNLALADSAFGNRDSLLTVPTVRSAQVSLRHEFNDRISAFLDVGRYENNTIRRGTGVTGLSSSQTLINIPATLPGGAPNPANPFLQDIRIAVPMVGLDPDRLQTESDSLSDRIGAGITVRLPGDWMAHAEYNYGASEFSYGWQRALTPAITPALANGTLNPLRDLNRFPLDFTPYYATGAAAIAVDSVWPAEQKNGTLRVAGPLMRMSGGPLTLSALVDRREEYTGDRVTGSFNDAGVASYTYYPEAGSTTRSAYAELTAPIFSRINARPGIRSLDLMASYRYDEVSNSSRPFLAGMVTVPSMDGPFPDVPSERRKVDADQYTLGFRYSPAESVALRVSFGKGVLPPNPNQLAVNDLFALGARPAATLIDQKRGNTPIDTTALVSYTGSGRQNLLPEQSESLSVGMIFKPAVLPGLRLSVDYTRIEKEDEIATIGSQAILDLEDLFPGSVVRNPVTPADAARGYTGGTIRELHIGPVNISKMLVEAFDVQATYDWSTPFGSFTANLIGTVQPTRVERATPTSVERNPVGYSNGPLRVRANAGLRWTLGNVDAGWDMQYYDAYRVYSETALAAARATAILSQGSAVVPSQTYHDVHGRYRFEGTGFAGGLLKNSDLLLSVQNAFNSVPPALATTASSGLGGYSTEGNPRLRRYSISFTKSFR